MWEGYYEINDVNGVNAVTAACTGESHRHTLYAVIGFPLHDVLITQKNRLVFSLVITRNTKTLFASDFVCACACVMI